MSEVNAIDKWIYATLAADSALAAVVGTRIYADQAPQTEPPVAFPFVVYQMQAAGDLMVVGGVRVWTNALYLVRGIDEGNSYQGNLKTIADRIDAVLHRGSGSNADGTVYAAIRESPFHMPEVGGGGQQYRNLGGLYRIYCA